VEVRDSRLRPDVDAQFAGGRGVSPDGEVRVGEPVVGVVRRRDERLRVEPRAVVRRRRGREKLAVRAEFALHGDVRAEPLGGRLRPS
jgi:hypothetical protein